MTRSDDLYSLPPGIPTPVDDGACDHLTGMPLPRVALRSTSGRLMDLSAASGTLVVYCYPRTGRPDVDPLAGWNEIPGARGCTPQSCAFRDHHRDVKELGAMVFGLSTQNTEYQKEAVDRLHLPFELLSDAALEFAAALRLPTFELVDQVFIKRLTLVTRDARIAKVFYPVFPPDQNAADVVRWLSRRIDGVSP